MKFFIKSDVSSRGEISHFNKTISQKKLLQLIDGHIDEGALTDKEYDAYDELCKDFHFQLLALREIDVKELRKIRGKVVAGKPFRAFGEEGVLGAGLSKNEAAGQYGKVLAEIRSY